MFHSVKDISGIHSNHFARPLTANFASIDCLITPRHLFQSTVCGKHDIQMNGLKLVTAQLEKQFGVKEFDLVFVVPSDRLNHWNKEQTYRTSKDNEAKNPPKNVRQWVMAIDLFIKSEDTKLPVVGSKRKDYPA